MIYGIVGAEAAKFTTETEIKAKQAILLKLMEPGLEVEKVVSGACHLGGIDTWAVQIATSLMIPIEEFPPKNKTWHGGYKPRNIQIAEAADKVICIAIKEYPPEYRGMRFKLCYHCKTSDHIKSGGCWTMHYAARLGKETQLIII